MNGERLWSVRLVGLDVMRQGSKVSAFQLIRYNREERRTEFGKRFGANEEREAMAEMSRLNAEIKARR